MAETQNFENHAKFVPGYHIVTFGIFAINFFWRIYQLIHAPSGEAAVNLLLAIAFVLTLLYARIFALTVQDRVIRTEMRLRMQRLLPADLQSRADEFSLSQLVALRFAGDQELPELARKVLEGKIEDRKAIKKMVKNWQADLLRA
jgi:hypothetical protein